MTSTTSNLLTQRSFLTAGGTETYIAFQQGFAMRQFCAFEIFDHPAELSKLRSDYLDPVMTAVADNGHGLLLDALIWRAHPDYITALGYNANEINRINHSAIAATRAGADAWRQQKGHDAASFPVLIAADIGPRGDGYSVADGVPEIDDAYAYHRVQIDALKSANVDVVFSQTLTSANEAIGIVRAATELDIPIIVSPTVETDGRLPDGMSLNEFIARVDNESTSPPLYYTVNCAHPTHLQPTLERAAAAGESWLSRFKGLRANASCKSHEELDNSTELDRGDPETLAQQILFLKQAFDLNIVGGCCGTDHEHIAAIAKATAVHSLQSRNVA